jgi:hypothetical protein
VRLFLKGTPFHQRDISIVRSDFILLVYEAGCVRRDLFPWNFKWKRAICTSYDLTIKSDDSYSESPDLAELKSFIKQIRNTL